MNRSFVVISVVNLLLTGAAYLYITHSASTERARQLQQGRVVERRLCTTLDSLAALRPPPGSPGSNPSRAYLQRQHAALAQLGTDVGCKR